MDELFTYCVKNDAGAAPNPFWGTCTLVICKPGIRRAAVVGDWVVGTGSRNSPVGDLGGRVVYAMQVGRRMTMAEYDWWAQRECPEKVPDPTTGDYRRVVGDAVYDFSADPPRVRPSVHDETNRAKDLSGKYALVGERFVYFGRAAVPLPAALRPIVLQGPGFRSKANRPYAAAFRQWLSELGVPWVTVASLPAMWPSEGDPVTLTVSARGHAPALKVGRSGLASSIRACAS